MVRVRARIPPHFIPSALKCDGHPHLTLLPCAALSVSDVCVTLSGMKHGEESGSHPVPTNVPLVPQWMTQAQKLTS